MKMIITKTVKQSEAKHLMINNKSYAISNKSKNFSKFGYLIISGIVATFTNSTKVLEQIKRKHQLAKIYTINTHKENYMMLSYTVLNDNLDYETKKEVAYFCNFDKKIQAMVCFDIKANKEHKKHNLISSLMNKYQWENNDNRKQILINILMNMLVLKGYSLKKASEVFTQEYNSALYSTTYKEVNTYIANDLCKMLQYKSTKIKYHKNINKIAKYVEVYKKASNQTIKDSIAYNLYNYLTIVKCNDNWENVSKTIKNLLGLNAIEAVIFLDEHNNYFRMKKDKQLKINFDTNFASLEKNDYETEKSFKEFKSVLYKAIA